MKQNHELTQLFIFCFVVLFLIAIFFITPSLQMISILTVLNILFMSPIVHFLEKKIPRMIAILSLFLLSGGGVVVFMGWITGVAINQWNTLARSIPTLTAQLISKVKDVEVTLQQKFDLGFDLGLSTLISNAGSASTSWAISHATGMISWLASAFFLIPIFSFFLLKDGDRYQRELLKLIPPRFRDEIVSTLDRTLIALSRFLRAKVIEALMVAVMTYIGLLLYGVDYAAVLALIAGITNIIPYIGPVLGLIPAVALLGFDWPVWIIYGVVNAIDMMIIFPIMVGRLVNLSPLTLLVSVAVGQELYGLTGMLLSVPVASSIKIIYQEIVEVLYPSSEQTQ